MRIQLVCLAALAVSGCVTVTTDLDLDGSRGLDPTPKETVEARNAVFMKTYADRDPEAMADLYVVDGMLVPPAGSNVIGRVAVANNWDPSEDPAARLDLRVLEVIDAGDYLIERSLWDQYAPDDTWLSGGKAVVIWSNEEGPWKIKWDTWTSTPTRVE